MSLTNIIVTLIPVRTRSKSKDFKSFGASNLKILIKGVLYLLRTVVVRVIWLLDLQLPMQSVHITTNVVIQHVMIKFVCDLLQVRSFFWVLWFPPPN